MKTTVALIPVAILMAMQSCGKHEKVTPLFQPLANTGIDFINHVKDNDTINILNYRNFYNGGGVAIGDINNDGLADVFFTANQGSNKLFLNKGNWQFEDISARAGFTDKLQFSTGVVMADINNDGWLDIFVCNAGSMNNAALRSNQLFINNHNLGFTESAAQYGLQDSGYTTQVSFFDYDMDGDLDCFKIDNSPIPINSLNYPQMRGVPASQWPVADYLKGGGDHLYRNDLPHSPSGGGGRGEAAHPYFTEVTQQAGIHGSLMSFGLGVTVGDVNGDHYPDIYVSNDFFERDYLYINQHNGTFKDELEGWLGHTSYASMGADIGDINNDGNPDIFTTDMLPADDYRLKTTLSFDNIDLYRLRVKNGFYNQFLENTLQLNTGHQRMLDIAAFSGVSASEWSWGALMLDADNDGWNDLYICNGIYRDLTNQDFLDFDAGLIQEKMIANGKKDLTELVDKIPSIAVPNKMFRNLGNLKFADEGATWGFTENSFSNGAAYGDLDNDGDLDIVVNNVNEPAFVFRNNSRAQNHNNFIGIQLKGKDGNRFAVGAKIEAYMDGTLLSREVMPSRGFQSSVDYRQVIGIGKATTVDSLVVIWPDLTYTAIIRPAINKYLSIEEQPNGPRIKQPAPVIVQPYLEACKAAFDKHTEDDYTDFYQERAIPQLSSREGPKAAVADVNGDGLEDVFIGGSAAKPGQLYMQTPAGDFVKKHEAVLEQFAGFEDGAVLFFDCDGDHDPDLFIGAAGNAASPSSRELQHRLFINDGKGNFILSDQSFPVNQDNTAVAVACDIDQDGDQDLFTGAFCVSGQYGVTPRSHVYINNGKGIFSDMPGDKINGIYNAGMVTSAVWADISGDNKKELVIAGEWMSPRIFSYEKNRFIELKTNLDELHGWWQTVAAADLDDDGKEDLVLGNFGENFYLQPDKQHPVKIWISDFDGNGSIDKVITRFIDGKDKPVFMKRELESELPVLKKQNLHHAEYAKKSVQEIFTAEQLQKAQVKTIDYAASCIAWNRGQGNFDIRKMPGRLQLSSVRAMLPVDIDGNGTMDIITTGNDFDFQPQLGRLDANEGDILINDGKRNFTVPGTDRTGISLRGQGRDIVLIKGRSGTCLLFLQNDEYPLLYKLTIKKTAM